MEMVESFKYKNSNEINITKFLYKQDVSSAQLLQNHHYHLP